MTSSPQKERVVGGQGRASAKGVTSGALLVIDREGLLGPPPKPSAAAPYIVSSY